MDGLPYCASKMQTFNKTSDMLKITAKYANDYRSSSVTMYLIFNNISVSSRTKDLLSLGMVSIENTCPGVGGWETKSCLRGRGNKNTICPGVGVD